MLKRKHFKHQIMLIRYNLPKILNYLTGSDKNKFFNLSNLCLLIKYEKYKKVKTTLEYLAQLDDNAVQNKIKSILEF